jgi:asparagine synthase (glutamine-hydrolysing)
MCGITGVVGPPGTVADPCQVRDALTRIRHRGPDDEGYLLADTRSKIIVPCGGRGTDLRLSLPDVGDLVGRPFNIALGHRRLSILDLSPAGHQPMVSPDASCWIVLNGEIYNYLELREELGALGHCFRTGTDTEVVLAAYQQWGSTMLPRLVGMFALAIVDVRADTLFAARDPFGIKPLYYSRRGKQLVFASEIKALLGIPGIGHGINAGRLYEYLLFGMTDHGGETMFADVQQLPAAHFLECSLEQLASAEPQRYWRIDLIRRSECSFDEAAAGIRDALADSVRLHMRSDVPVGTCLSGGLDSSATVYYMRRNTSPRAEIHSFTYVTDDPVLGEERYADLVSARERTTPHKTRPRPEELMADLDRLICSQDEPFMSTSIYAQYRVFRLAKKTGTKVMLDGQGADELFGGYLNFLGARASGLLAQGRLIAALRVALGAPTNESANFHRMVGSAFGRLLPDSLVRAGRSALGDSLRPAWLNWRWFEERGVSAHLRPRGRGKDALREELLLALETLSLPQLLRYEDRNSMAHSIESRVPFCNARLAELALSLRGEFIVDDRGTTKAVLREAVRGLVPDEVLLREKVGFAVPERSWLRSLRPWLTECVDGMSASNVPFLRWERASHTIKSELEAQGYAGGVPWRLVNLARWMSALSVDARG